MITRSNRLCTVFMVMILAALLGCAPNSTLPTVQSSPTTQAAVTLTDSAGRAVTIQGRPQRIVSLAPSATEILFALGAGDRVVAVDNLSDYPAETKNLPKIKILPLSLENVVSFKPDLILMASGMNSPEEIKGLADLKLTVLVVSTLNTTFETVMSDILLVGKATGTEVKAKDITDGMNQKVQTIKTQIAKAKTKPRVYWELDATDPAKPFTPGPGSFVNDLITMAGGVNIAADAKSPYTQINAEQIVAANPDLIIMSDAAYGVTIESVKQRPGWANLDAIKNNRIYPIEDSLVSRPGPRLVQGLEAAAKLIHPELFPQ